MSWEITQQIALDVVKGLSGGFAIFNPDNQCMIWCNVNFRKQTWFGAAVGGKNATEIQYMDFFLEEDMAAAKSLFNIARDMGSAYDFQRALRRGPTGNFPAELKFRSIKGPLEQTYILLEIRDLSINKQFEDLEIKHHTMKDQFSSVLAEQADLHYSVRLGTLSELGADMAHSLINPITMCKGILEREITPIIPNGVENPELQKVFNYLKGIEDLALWFRKFSDPKLSEPQYSQIHELVEDAVILNMSKLTKYGMSYQVRNYTVSSPQIFGLPFHVMSWIGSCIGEILLICRNDSGPLSLTTRLLSPERVAVVLSCPVDEVRRCDFNPKTMEMQIDRLPKTASWHWTVSKNSIEITLEFECRTQNNVKTDTSDINLNTHSTAEANNEISEKIRLNSLPVTSQETSLKNKNKNDQRATNYADQQNIACILIVDDEEDIRRLVKRSLSVFNAEIWEAENGLKALDLLQKKSLCGDIDRLLAIVSDVRMPEMNGIQLLKAIKSKKMDCPFVFLSSNLVDPSETGNSGEEHGVYYLTKESKLEKLKELLSSKLGIAKALA